MYDVIIIGGGPAGLSAALYAARRSLKTLVIAKSVGGQATIAPVIENYPGIDKISGGELSAKFYTQASKFGAEIKSDEIKSITKDKHFALQGNSKKYQARSVILAFGKTPQDLGVKGEEEFKSKGVSYCATCDGLFFKDKIVAVIGGGNSAAESAILLAKTSKQVYLIHRREEFTAEKVLFDEITKNPKIKTILNSVITEIKGSDVVGSVDIQSLKDKSISNLALSGVFVEIGFVVKADFVKKLVELDKRNQIIINELNQTKTPGLFAAGDVTQIRYKQIIIACGEGAKTALAVYDYLAAEKGKTGIYSTK